jgi:outer membrane lipopolysaccharide assembly protein LptE/RlpB
MKMRTRLPTLWRTSAALALAAGVLLQTGCGYSLAGRGSFLPVYIQRIGVPLFTNSTAVFDLDRQVTEKVRSEFIGRGKWTIVPEATGVDGLVTGVISSVVLNPVAFNSAQQATRYALILTAQVEFKDMRTNKVLWTNSSMQYREEFQLNPTNALDTTTFLGQDVNARERMANEFARALVSAILEAF